MKTVQIIRSGLYSGFKTESYICYREVVADKIWDYDKAYIILSKPRSNLNIFHTADQDDRIDFEVFYRGEYFGRLIDIIYFASANDRIIERVAVAGKTENGTSAIEKSLEEAPVRKTDKVPIKKAVKTIFYGNDHITTPVNCTDSCPDSGINAGSDRTG
jgi:hypothetical protein